MKKTFTLGAIALIMFSCQKETPISALEDTNQGKLFQMTATDGNLEIIARQLAAALSKKEVREFVKLEAQKKFDGDFNFLFSEAEKKIVDGQTFLSHLAGKNNSDQKGKSKADALSNQLSALAKELPLLQVAVPVNIEKWDTENFSPLVVIKSLDFNERTTEKVKAFDQNGTIHWLDVKKEPEFPVIVLGINERTEVSADGVVTLKHKKTLAKKSNGNTVSLLPPPPGDDDGGGGGGGTTVSSVPCSRTDLQYDYMDAINCTDISQYESFLGGAPELRFFIIAKAGLNVGINNVIYSGFYEPQRRDDINNTWDNLYMEMGLFAWRNSVYGDQVIYKWIEEDPGNPVTKTINTQITSPLTNITTTFSASWQQSDDSYEMGHVPVDQTICPTSGRYDVGGVLSFKLRAY